MSSSGSRRDFGFEASFASTQPIENRHDGQRILLYESEQSLDENVRPQERIVEIDAQRYLFRGGERCV